MFPKDMVMVSSLAILGCVVALTASEHAENPSECLLTPTSESVILLQTRTSAGGSQGLEDSFVASLLKAQSCLQLTTPTQALEYPVDAEQHFEDIHAALGSLFSNIQRDYCYAGYCGPWTEIAWIDHFTNLWKERSSGAKLADIFGPYIPLFVPWTHIWRLHMRAHHQSRFAGIMEEVRRNLRPNVPYITVCQNAQGMTADSPYGMDAIPNVLVLSAGGYGHVPIPLLLAEMTPQSKPLTERSLFAEYEGIFGHSPRQLRSEMRNIVNSEVTSGVLKDLQVNFGTSKKWKSISADSRFHLVPRGFGRTSFRLMEMVQMGLIPIHVYSDIPWLPYMRLWNATSSEKVGFMTTLDGLKPLLESLRGMSDEEVEAMEQRILSKRETHFTREATWRQISSFMTGGEGGGDLVCQKLPATVRDA